ncbi:MAG: LysM peptidoglycan-binding domain-containing protein, partial [Bacteroidota bacterium]|nr:LysM peptidoglycan-binding domain-containing protein [Bacteroidota bacterium]
GIRMESLLAYNFLSERMQPAEGEKLYCQATAPARPMLAEEKKTVLREMNNVVKPADTTHVVQTKETLYSISKKYGVSTEQLKSWNKLDSADLRIGQQLLIRSAQ